jgi:hypothetical protein
MKGFICLCDLYWYYLLKAIRELFMSEVHVKFTRILNHFYRLFIFQINYIFE